MRPSRHQLLLTALGVLLNALGLVSVLQFPIMHCCPICLLVHYLLLVMTFTVRFSTVHMGLVVYVATDAVLGVVISKKGRRSVTDTFYARGMQSRALSCGLGAHGGYNV